MNDFITLLPRLYHKSGTKHIINTSLIKETENVKLDYSNDTLFNQLLHKLTKEIIENIDTFANETYFKEMLPFFCEQIS